MAYILVILGTAVGTVAGSLGAAYLAKEQIPRMCVTIGAGILIFTIMNIVNVKPPTWVAALSILGVLAAVPIAMNIARQKGFGAPA